MKRMLVAAMLFSSAVAAHIELDSPTVRYSNGTSVSTEVNKHCPCGGGAGTSTCSGAVTSDPNRSATRVTTFAPGETIVVEWRETIGHTGRYRIAFDPDGADLADFNQNILLDIADPSGSEGNTGNGNRWRAEVTLPSTPCTNCTLQLLQIMNGNTSQPVADPTGMSSYFQCADIVIRAPGEGEGEGEGEPGEGEGEGGGETGEGEGEDHAHEGEGGDHEHGGEGEGEDDDTDDDGCSQTGQPTLWLGLVGLLALRRRR
jgi:hypothetical protein